MPVGDVNKVGNLPGRSAETALRHAQTHAGLFERMIVVRMYS